MTVISTLAVNVVSNTGGLTRGLDKARSSMKQTGNSAGGLGGMFKGLNPLTIGITAAAAGAAIAVAKVGEAMKRLDDIGKRSTSLGMMPQQLMSFNNAAVLGGVGADKMSKALQKMQRGVGEAALGVGTMKVALDAMNIDVNEFKALSPDEQMKVFADSIKDIKNPAERAAHATNIFGKAGADMIPMLENGRAGLEAMEAETVRLQGTMSKTDIKAVEDSNDAWAKFGMAMEGIWNQIAVAVAPALETVGNILADIFGWIANIIDAYNDFMTSDAQDTGRSIQRQSRRI
jgi:cytochrome c556